MGGEGKAGRWSFDLDSDAGASLLGPTKADHLCLNLHGLGDKGAAKVDGDLVVVRGKLVNLCLKGAASGLEKSKVACLEEAGVAQLPDGPGVGGWRL